MCLSLTWTTMWWHGSAALNLIQQMRHPARGGRRIIVLLAVSQAFVLVNTWNTRPPPFARNMSLEHLSSTCPFTSIPRLAHWRTGSEGFTSSWQARGSRWVGCSSRWALTLTLHASTAATSRVRCSCASYWKACCPHHTSACVKKAFVTGLDSWALQIPPIVLNVVRAESAGTDHLQKVQLYRGSMQLRKPAQAPRGDQPPPVKAEPDDVD
jgi:hypothetical protein